MGPRSSSEDLRMDAERLPLRSAAIDGDHSRVRTRRPSSDFRRIFDAHAPTVTRTLRYLGVPEADLMDAAQEVFLVVNRRFREFEGRSSLSTWIRQICLRVALSTRRRRGRRRED